jgi:hypothetical protein
VADALHANTNRFSAKSNGQPAAVAAAREPFVLPDNLRKFFRAMREKNGG